MGFPYPDYRLVSAGKGAGRYTVQVSGREIATVQKNTTATSIFSAISGLPGPAEWIVNVPGRDPVRCDKREIAVRTAIRMASPPVVGEGTYDKYQGLTDVTLWFAGYTFGVSRFDGEGKWHIDSKVRPGAWFPEFCNGSGSRCVRTSTIKDPAVIALLEAERAAAVGRYLESAKDSEYLP